ncbi:MAG TPA: nuclease-related domain-containing protein [Gaiellaceae bacterium]|nr:nuclease-related domain-containing protein [Gaiellaceae bacterium]
MVLLGLGLASVALLTWNPAPIVSSVLLILAALGLRVLVNREADVALRWLRGARAETSVGEELNALRLEGFVILHDVDHRGEGNIDHLVSGPTGVFLVETKLRRYHEAHLVKVKRQAVRLHAELGTWITPVICLHQRGGRPFKTKGVWIVPQPALRDWIRGQRNAVVRPERVLRLADGL